MSDAVIVFGNDPSAPLRLDPDGGAVLRFGAYLDVHTTDLPDYEGPYIAVPSWARQDFPTADHAMRDDFSVQPMLELETPNEAGGLTLTI